MIRDLVLLALFVGNMAFLASNLKEHQWLQAIVMAGSAVVCLAIMMDRKPKEGKREA